MKKILLPIVTLVGMCLVTGCDGALPSSGVSTRDKITQREITREEAKIVSTDINNKQDAEFGTGSSSTISSASAIKLAVNPAIKAAKTTTNNDYDSWEYGDSYDWGDYEDGDYEDDWSYQKQDGEDDWGYKDGQDYNTWYQDRAAKKKVELPSAATFSMYASIFNFDISQNKKVKEVAEIVLEYDFDKYYIHEKVSTKTGDKNEATTSASVTDDSNFDMDAWIYYKDGYFKGFESYNGQTNNLFDPTQLSDAAAKAFFNTQKKLMNSAFRNVCGGSSYLMFVDMFKESGFECRYGSNDAGNLEMIIKGEDITELGTMMTSTDDITVSFDASFVWDQYFMRSMEMHMCGATNNKIMEEHAKVVLKDGCTPIYPANA